MPGSPGTAGCPADASVQLAGHWAEALDPATTTIAATSSTLQARRRSTFMVLLLGVVPALNGANTVRASSGSSTSAAYQIASGRVIRRTNAQQILTRLR